MKTLRRILTTAILAFSITISFSQPPQEGSSEYYSGLAAIWIRIGNTPSINEEALKYANKAIELNNRNSQAFAVRGYNTLATIKSLIGKIEVQAKKNTV